MPATSLPPWPKRLRRALRYPFVRAALGFAAILPFGFALWLGGRLGRLAFLFAGSQRRLALAHLALAFPELSPADRRDLARSSFEGLGRAALEACQARRLDGRLQGYVRWPAEEIALLRAALSPGKGGLFITGHVGNWELLARRVVAEGFDHVVVTRDSGDPRLAGLVDRFRAAGGVRAVGRGMGSRPLRELLAAFHRGALVGLLIDQDTRVQGLQIPFFGHLAHTPRAAEDLAARTGAPVFVGFIHPDPAGGHLLHTERILGPAEGLTARLTARIEAEIRAHPSDWVWMHRRWRRSAGPAPSVQPTDTTVGTPP